MLTKLATFSKCDLKLKYPTTTLVERGYVFQEKTGKINCCNCGFALENLDASLEAIYAEHAKWGPNCNFSKPENFSDGKENVDKGSVTTELEKLKSAICAHGSKEAGTVGGTSVVKNKLQVLKLSSNELNELFPNGTKPGLKSIIVSAQERQRRWENENQVGNDTVRRTAAPGRPETVDVPDSSDSGVFSHANSTLNCACSLPHITIQDLVHGAKHPALVSRSERRRTFVGKEHRYEHCVATIDHFVEAGFYYIGPNDNVRCFYCDGGLKNFKQNDDPWREHKRWFRDCKFVDYRENLLLGHDHPDGDL